MYAIDFLQYYNSLMIIHLYPWKLTPKLISNLPSKLSKQLSTQFSRCYSKVINIIVNEKMTFLEIKTKITDLWPEPLMCLRLLQKGINFRLSISICTSFLKYIFSWKNQVWQTGFLVYFKLDFYCLFTLQKNPALDWLICQKSSTVG